MCVCERERGTLLPRDPEPKHKKQGGSEPSIIDEDGGRSAVKQPGTPDCAPASVTAIVFLKCFSIDMGLSLEPQYAA